MQVGQVVGGRDEVKERQDMVGWWLEGSCS